MKKLLLSRLGQLLLALWTVGTLTFVLMRNLPGDMAYRVAASRYGYDQVDTIAAQSVRAELGLDLPWYQSYLHWLWDLLRLDLGESLVSGDKVWNEIAHQLGHTLCLAVVALLISLCVSAPLGVWLAHKKNAFLDKSALIATTFLRSMPAFALGALLIALFAAHLKWLPAIGYGKSVHYVLPALTLALGLSASGVRVCFAAAKETFASSYYQFGRLKGLGGWRLFWRHGARNVAIPVVAYHNVQFIYLIEGVVVVESLFARPGIGHALVHAILARDVPMIQGAALVMGALFVFLNASVDALSRLIDPRFRL